MQVFRSKDSLQQFLTAQRDTGKTIGFVPTMGALHNGHLSLIQEAQKKSNITVCSIYVNPTQFNDPADLEKYPRTEEKDLQMLESVSCDVCYFPTTEELYPNGTSDLLNIDLGGLDSQMEGEHRPGHFKGVVTVVKNLFDVVKPDSAFFGEKDFQQLAIIRRMVEVLKLPLEIIGCSIIREKNGLAMSSRNERLSDTERSEASLIYKTLEEVTLQRSSDFERKDLAKQRLSQNSNIVLDYFEIADSKTLQPADENTIEKRAFIAAFVGEVRLIDNIALD